MELKDLIRSGISENLPEDEILAKIAAYIYQLIEQDPQKLMQILYRLDVFEKDIQQAMSENNLKLRSHFLAKAIIQRQMIKLKNWKGD
jgi:hypothetical protein